MQKEKCFLQLRGFGIRYRLGCGSLFSVPLSVIFSINTHTHTHTHTAGRVCRVVQLLCCPLLSGDAGPSQVACFPLLQRFSGQRKSSPPQCAARDIQVPLLCLPPNHSLTPLDRLPSCSAFSCLQETRVELLGTTFPWSWTAGDFALVGVTVWERHNIRHSLEFKLMQNI